MHLSAQIADAGTSSPGLFIGPFALLALAIPELLLGEFIFHRVGWLHVADEDAKPKAVPKF